MDGVTAHTPRMMSGQSIICFAKDWNEDPTSNNHIVAELAKQNRVLWLNSIATPPRNIGSARDWKKIWHKLVCSIRGCRKMGPNLWVYTPLVIPLPHSRWAKLLNRWILKFSLLALRRYLGMRDFQLWTFLPNVGDYIGKLGE